MATANLSLEAEAALLVARNRDAESGRRAPGRGPLARRPHLVSSLGLEQRKAARAGLRNVRESRLCDEFELRSKPNGTGGTDLVFTGYASVTGTPYPMEDHAGPYSETVVRGAFAKTLADGADVCFLLNHEGVSMARTAAGTMTLAEHTTGSPTGLWVEARLDPKRPDVQMLRSAIERGDLSEMSFAFRVTRQQWKWAEDTGSDMDERYIQEVSMAQGDVSVVNYGANPHTGGLVAVRKRFDAAVAAARWELREGKTISAATLDKLKTAAGHLGDSDTAAARGVIQELMALADPGKSGAAGNTESESAKKLDVEAALLVARNRDADRRR